MDDDGISLDKGPVGLGKPVLRTLVWPGTIPPTSVCGLETAI